MTLAGDWLTSLGNRRMTQGTGNVGTYTSGGIAVTPKQCGLGLIEFIDIDSAGGYVFRYDAANAKIMAYQSDDAVDPLDEVGSVDLSAVTFSWRAVGR